jgi:hypothetical protein
MPVTREVVRAGGVALEPLNWSFPTDTRTEVDQTQLPLQLEGLIIEGTRSAPMWITIYPSTIFQKLNRLRPINGARWQFGALRVPRKRFVRGAR